MAHHARVMAARLSACQSTVTRRFRTRWCRPATVRLPPCSHPADVVLPTSTCSSRPAAMEVKASSPPFSQTSSTRTVASVVTMPTTGRFPSMEESTAFGPTVTRSPGASAMKRRRTRWKSGAFVAWCCLPLPLLERNQLVNATCLTAAHIIIRLFCTCIGQVQTGDGAGAVRDR